MRATSLTLILAGLASGCATAPCASSQQDDGGVSVACGDSAVTYVPGVSGRRATLVVPEIARPLTDRPDTVKSFGTTDDGAPVDPGLPPDPGTVEAPPQDHQIPPVLVWTQPADEAACPNGGTEVITFTDENFDGQYNTDEAHTSAYLCDDEVEKQVLVSSREIPAGPQCVTGGAALVSGLDADGDLMLEDDEIAETVVTCNPQPLTAEAIPGYQVRTHSISEFSVRAAVSDMLTAGRYNWGIRLSEHGTGRPISDVQLAYDTKLGSGPYPLWSMPVVTLEDGAASFGPEAAFNLNESEFGGQGGGVMYLRIVTEYAGNYDVQLDLLQDGHGPAMGRTIFPLTVNP